MRFVSSTYSHHQGQRQERAQQPVEQSGGPDLVWPHPVPAEAIWKVGRCGDEGASRARVAVSLLAAAAAPSDVMASVLRGLLPSASEPSRAASVGSGRAALRRSEPKSVTPELPRNPRAESAFLGGNQEPSLFQPHTPYAPGYDSTLMNRTHALGDLTLRRALFRREPQDAHAHAGKSGSKVRVS